MVRSSRVGLWTGTVLALGWLLGAASTPVAAQTVPTLPKASSAQPANPAPLAAEPSLPAASAQASQQAPAAQPAPQNPTIKVGIVQRFGEQPDQSTLTLEPPSGDRLSITFETGGQTETITTTGPIKVDVVVQPLPEPQVRERVVLSTHRSFESAEDSAKQWRSRGIEVEIAQPRQWQVWAKRDTYSNPLVRRLLMRNLEAQGSRGAFLQSRVERESPKASFVINNFRYTRDQFSIAAGTNRIYVNQGTSPQTRQLFGGSLRIQPNAYGNYTLVNDVPIETYLRGVVPHEIGLQAPPTAIQAQAILARTYALRNLRRFEIDNYQLCADTQCQVYKGLSGAAEITDRAIAATQGQVLTYGNELIDALYSSTTGGVTASFSDVWNGADRPYLRPRVDSVQSVWDLNQFPLSDERNFRSFIALTAGFNEVGWDTFRWRREGTLAEIAAGLKQYLQGQQHPLARMTSIRQMEVLERANSGRVQKVAVQTDVGTVILEKDEILRALIPPRSLLFYMEPMFETIAAPPAINPPTSAESPTGTPSSTEPITPTPSPAAQTQTVLKGYAFVGGGLGHAVGMSQTGAYNLGRLNWSASRILEFYYPGTRLQPLTDRLVLWRDPDQVLTNATSLP
ncbi:SpoIID/LytB domain-containing protein [Leptolyngbya sp. AN02str]|uniref:SpoIID/LytB domain-containing protein n=1 Tax=Leptolyngbya sp. AN02str TaxID=3423363 RepID=UPI003D31D2FB